jgi:hypothetical protein
MGHSKHAHALANTYARTATSHRVLGVVFVVDKPQGKLARLPDTAEREREREIPILSVPCVFLSVWLSMLYCAHVI